MTDYEVRPVHLKLVPPPSINGLVADEDRERETLERFAEELRRVASELPESSSWKRDLKRAWQILSRDLRKRPRKPH